MARSPFSYFILDVVFLAIFCAVCGAAAWASVWVAPSLPSMSWLALYLPVGLLTFILSMLAIIFVLRLLVGRLREGRYPFPGSAQTVRWMFHFTLSRIIHFNLWRQLIYGVSTLRFLALRALGARVAFGFDASADATVLDACLHQIGPEAMLGAGTQVAGHFVLGKEVRLAGCRVGAGTQLLYAVQLGPGTALGDRVSVGPRTVFAGRTSVGDDTQIAHSCFVGTEVEIGRGVVIGPHCILEQAVKIADGARVPAYSTLSRGTRVAAAESA